MSRVHFHSLPLESSRCCVRAPAVASFGSNEISAKSIGKTFGWGLSPILKNYEISPRSARRGPSRLRSVPRVQNGKGSHEQQRDAFWPIRIRQIGRAACRESVLQ